MAMAGYAQQIEAIALETLEIVCYLFPLEEWERGEPAVRESRPQELRAVVVFEGAADGCMMFQPDRELLESIAANMLGVDQVGREHREGALSEVANIICGNTVPVFAHDSTITTLQPPRMADPKENLDKKFAGMEKETVELFFDEGRMEITLWYSRRVRDNGSSDHNFGESPHEASGSSRDTRNRGSGHD